MIVANPVQPVNSTSFQEPDETIRADEERKAREEEEKVRAAMEEERRNSARKEALDSEQRGRNIDETA